MQLRAYAAHKDIAIRRHFSQKNCWSIFDDPVGLRDGREDYVTFIHILGLVL